MTHDFHIIHPHYGILKITQSDVVDRLIKLENDRQDLTIFVQKFPDIEKCCKNLNLKFDTILKEFKIIKDRVEELAETAHEALNKSETVEEKIKIFIDVNPDHLKELDTRVTDLAKQFVVVKTVTEQSKEICTVVQDQVSNLKTDIITPIVKSELDKEVIDIKDELDHMKGLIEDDLEMFKKEIDTKIMSIPNNTKLETRINEIADVADSNLTKIEEITENLKPVVDISDDLTQLTDDFKIIKTTVTKNREICTAVETKADKLEGDLTIAKKDLESSIEDMKVSLHTEIEGVKDLIKSSNPIDSKELEKLKTRINEIADVAHEAGKCCDEIDDLKKKLEENANNLNQNVATLDKKINDNEINLKKLEENAKLRDDELDKLTEAKSACEAAVKELKDSIQSQIDKTEKLTSDATDRDVKIKDLEDFKIRYEEVVKTLTEADSNLKSTLDTLIKQHDTDFKKVTEGTEQDINNLKQLIADQTKALTDLKTVQDKLKTEMYEKLKTDYIELKEIIDNASGLTIDAVKEALNWVNLIDRIEFLENEVNVNIKVRFVNLENSLIELQGVASDAHDLATLLQQTLKNVPNDIEILKEKTSHL
ncbi:putative filamentous protein [Lymphocystis disease virus 4]|uniref:Putative filamentous protein n=1 Tax=Lymphocystis disease virus 4 TaxID=2704413 RepID=A0A6B9XJU2_9VIRU|nr:putative filamentous protein [Lymphocystis disease virus 4]QHR78445.1 putative filamentous protein [Lymphocystis disease virus 4]